MMTMMKIVVRGSKEKTLRTPQAKVDYIRHRVHSNQQQIMEER